MATVARDVLGTSGRAMLEALVHGTSDPGVLAELARGRMRAKLPALREALVGHFRPHHAFLTTQILAHLDHLEATVDTLSERIATILAPFADAVQRLDTIPGINQRTAEVLIAEIGVDMGQFPSDRHLASWAGLCPGNHESEGGNLLSEIHPRVKGTAVVVLGAAMMLAATDPSFGAEKIRFKTDFSIVEYHAPFFAGIARGIYKQHQLDVEILPGTGSQGAVLDIAAEKMDFSFGDMSTLALAVLGSNVRNVKGVAAVFEVTPFTVLYLKNHGIKVPTDLNGKTMANFKGSGVGTLFTVFARRTGVDMASVKEILSAPAAYHNPLIVGQADFAPTTVNRLSTLADAARQTGNELAEFRFADFGLDLAGQAILANVKTIEQRPDVVRRFVQATLESVQWSARNPEQAVDYLVQAKPQLNKAPTLAGFKAKISEARIPPAETERVGRTLPVGGFGFRYRDLRLPVPHSSLRGHQR